MHISKKNIDVETFFKTLSNSKMLNLKEFGNFVKSLDPKIHPNEIETIFNKFDKNSDKLISVEEFTDLLVETDYTDYEVYKDPFLEEKGEKLLGFIKEKLEKNNLKIESLFNDDNKNGINFEEFTKLINSIDKDFTNKEIEYVFLKLDEDKNKKIDMRELTSALNLLTVENMKKKNDINKVVQDRIKDKKIFDELAMIMKNNDVRIKKIFKNNFKEDILNFVQFKKLILLFDETMGDDEITTIFEAFDINNKDQISFNNFQNYFN